MVEVDNKYKERLRAEYQPVKKNEMVKHKKTYGKSPQLQIKAAMNTPLFKGLTTNDNPQSTKAVVASKRTTIFTHERYIGSCIPAESKISITSFVHQLIEIFYLPDDDLTSIFNKYQINHLYLYLLFTDTDSCCIQYVTQLKKEGVYEDKEVQLVLKVYIATKISARLDKTHPYYKQFNIHSPDEKKKRWFICSGRTG